MPDSNAIQILLIEDSPSDARLMQECFRQLQTPNRLHVVTDGEQAMAYLRRQGDYHEVVMPHVILLDLDLPRVNGHEVLAAIKSDEQLRSIPVIVLTSSVIAEDVHRAYQLQANCYLAKPLDFEGYNDLIRSVEGFWLQHVRLPTPEAGNK